jgi:fructose-specific phosphotransferase system IIB component
MKIVIVTSCSIGIAHTYIAAEQLEKTGKLLGHQIKVETQGANGIENELTAVDIQKADFVIFAVDIAVERPSRFAARRRIQVPVREAILCSKGIFEKIMQRLLRAPDLCSASTILESPEPNS